MSSVSYADAAHAIREDIPDSHSRFWRRLQMPGAWLTSAEKIAIANEMRTAHLCPLCQQRKKALSPRSVSGEHQVVESSLRAPIVELVHSMINDAARQTESWYQSLLADGLTEGEYVEVVGTVVAMVSIDSFALGIGVPLRELPQPGSGDPTHYRPATAVTTPDAWVPMVPPDNANTPEADLWPAGKTGNVVRAMSLVPDEVRTLCELSAAHYLPMPKVRQPGVDAGRALNRSQMELVAGRVSALNQCYY